MKSTVTAPAGKELWRVIVIGDTCVSAEGMAAIVGRDNKYQVCGGAHHFDDAMELIRQHRPDVLLIEPFLEGRDGIRWINDLAADFPRTRILVVSRQSEMAYAERALRAGALGYWMKNSSAEELLRAVETVAAGEIYVSPAITALAVRQFGRNGGVREGLASLTDREIAVFLLVAAEHGVGRIAQELGVCRKTVESHCEHIKSKLGYPDADALKRGARELLGAGAFQNGSTSPKTMTE